jgi:chromosome segregation and condensation protein ScpB
MLPEDEITERYRHLLQPLRDISANWQMSIQEHLDDYLEKLQADRERNMTTGDGEVIK